MSFAITPEDLPDRIGLTFIRDSRICDEDVDWAMVLSGVGNAITELCVERLVGRHRALEQWFGFAWAECR
jgi:hypothetical protein